MNYHSLPTQILKDTYDYYHAGELPLVVHLDDPATDVLLDFKHTKALYVTSETSILEASHEMTVGNVHILLVTDELQRVIGVVSSEDILGEKPVKIIQEKNIMYKEVKVNMVMTHYTHMISVAMNDVKKAKVGHIIQTLQDARQYHALVIEENPITEEPFIRGIFSLTQISRQLDFNLSPHELFTANLVQLQE